MRLYEHDDQRSQAQMDKVCVNRVKITQCIHIDGVTLIYVVKYKKVYNGFVLLGLNAANLCENIMMYQMKQYIMTYSKMSYFCQVGPPNINLLDKKCLPKLDCLGFNFKI